MYCRGGPPWPPVVLIGFAKPETVDSSNSVPTTGGPGGPPLQYVPNFKLSVTIRNPDGVIIIEHFCKKPARLI